MDGGCTFRMAISASTLAQQISLVRIAKPSFLCSGCAVLRVCDTDSICSIAVPYRISITPCRRFRGCSQEVWRARRRARGVEARAGDHQAPRPGMHHLPPHGIARRPRRDFHSVERTSKVSFVWTRRCQDQWAVFCRCELPRGATNAMSCCCNGRICQAKDPLVDESCSIFGCPVPV